MADRLVVMSEGRIRQIGSQQDLYERPSEKFVADFVGRSTFIGGRMDGPGRFISAGGLVVACEATGAGNAALALRPERLALTSAADPAMDNSFAGAVEFISYLGSQVDLHIRLSPLERVIVQIQNRPEQPLPVPVPSQATTRPPTETKRPGPSMRPSMKVERPTKSATNLSAGRS